MTFEIKLAWILLTSYWTFLLGEDNLNFLIFTISCICGSKKIDHRIMDLEEIPLNFLFLTIAFMCSVS